MELHIFKFRDTGKQNLFGLYGQPGLEWLKAEVNGKIKT